MPNKPNVSTLLLAPECLCTTQLQSSDSHTCTHICTAWYLTSSNTASARAPYDGMHEVGTYARQHIWQVATQRVPGLPMIACTRWVLAPCHDAKAFIHSPPSRGTCQTSQMSVDHLSRQHAWLPDSHSPAAPTYTKLITILGMADCTSRAPYTATTLFLYVQ